MCRRPFRRAWRNQASFRATAAAWLAHSEAHAGQLARLEPPGQRQADRRSMLAAIDAGLLRRALVVARRE